MSKGRETRVDDISDTPRLSCPPSLTGSTLFPTLMAHKMWNKREIEGERKADPEREEAGRTSAVVRVCGVWAVA